MPKYWWFPSVFESKLTIQAGFWPYKQVNLLIECPFGSGPAKNWPYMRVDLTSVDLISGRGRDCTGLVNFVFVNWLHNPNWRNTKNIITKPVTISSKLSSFSLSLSLSLCSAVSPPISLFLGAHLTRFGTQNRDTRSRPDDMWSHPTGRQPARRAGI